MPKAAALMIAAAIAALTLTGCSGTTNPDPGTTAASTGGTTESQQAEAPNSSSDAKAEIIEHEFLADPFGDPALVVGYDFTNNTDTAAMFPMLVTVTATQDGNELDTTIVTGSGYDTTTAIKAVEPGQSLTVYQAYALTGSGPVTITAVSKTSGATLATETFQQ